jgi:glutamate synthase domain-containing protein 2
MAWWVLVLVGFAILLVAITVYDLSQRGRAVLRNFPVIGHLRYLLEAVGPELRQYIVTDNDEERPFSRDQRRWVYASAKRESNVFGFGTDNDLERSPNYLILLHSTFPIAGPNTGEYGVAPAWRAPSAKVLGAARGRTHALRMDSIVNISGMSFGSLSGAAVQALNGGAHIARCLQGTGEGSLTPHHAQGGELVWQIGTGYFGCRDEHGRFSIERFRETLAQYPQVRAIEVKLSQGAKPGLGGLLPGAKLTKEIAAIRGVPVGLDCHSPVAHSAFGSVDEMLDFVELLAAETGLPIGIKSAVGDPRFWERLGDHMATDTGRGVDFVVIDGGEGGSGAAPLAFSDHVALPFKVGFARVYREFARRRLTDRVVFVGSGKLGFPQDALLAFALGCDAINVGREAMLAIGCIQAQRCHTGRCPTGVAAQSAWLTRGLDPASKAVRCAHYIESLRQEILQLARANGEPHPALVTPESIELLDDRFGSRRALDVFGYEPGWGRPSDADCETIGSLMMGSVSPGPIGK